MDTVDASDLSAQIVDVVERVAHGEELLVTMSGRPVARLTPVGPGQWRRWDDVVDVFRGPVDPSWETDRRRVDLSLRDPWAAD